MLERVVRGDAAVDSAVCVLVDDTDERALPAEADERVGMLRPLEEKRGSPDRTLVATSGFTMVVGLFETISRFFLAESSALSWPAFSEAFLAFSASFSAPMSLRFIPSAGSPEMGISLPLFSFKTGSSFSA